MISFRHHLVSLVAVFLALAVGVVLGGGPLAELGRSQSVAAAARTETGLEAGFGDTFAAASAPALLQGRLADRSVVVLSLPGADREVADALGSRIEEAGGTVAASYALEPALLAPGEKALVDTLGSQLMTQYAAGEVAADAPTYPRLGRLIALATATTDTAGDAAGPRGRSVLDGLAGGGLVTADVGSWRRAPLVLVVDGGEGGTASAADPRAGSDADPDADSDSDSGSDSGSDSDAAQAAASGDAILTGLLAGLREGAAGVVLVGSTGDGAEGRLARVREDDQLAEVTTVDGVDTVVGQVTTVLALARALDGAAGDFGASGADGAVPLG